MSLFHRVANLFSRRRIEASIDAELRSHLEMRIEDNIAAGMHPDEARRDALLRFGNLTATKEHTHAEDTALVLEGIWSDLRYACRQLSRAPGFALTVIVTLALGIGANLAVFQLLYGVMFANLPIRQPGQLHSLHSVQSPFDKEWFYSYPAYQRLRQASGNSAPVIARSGLGTGVLEDRDGSSDRMKFQLVSGNFFSVLGVSPATGRLFTSNDDQFAQSEWPVVLHYEYALKRFGSDSAALGKHVVINEIPVVIVGVSAKGFDGVMRGFAPDLWLPIEAQSTGKLETWFDSFGPGYGINLDRSWQNQPGIFWLWLLARVPDAEESAAMARWTAALQPDLKLIADASKNKHRQEVVRQAHVQLVSASRGEGSFLKMYTEPLIFLMALAGAIFGIGCINLANLELARLWSRQREMSIRISLGAGRWRVLRQILIEDFLLALLGALAAWMISRLASAGLLRWASGRDWQIAVDLHPGAQFFLIGAALLIGALAFFSLLPGWWITRSNFAAVSGAKRVGTSAMPGRPGRRYSSLLLSGQVSLSLLLIGMAYLFGQTLRNIDHIDAGLDRDHIVSVHLDMRSTGFADGRKDLPILYQKLLDRVEVIPSVRSAAVHMCSIPACGWNTAIYAFGQPEMTADQAHGEEDHVGTDYFRTLQIPLLQGRDFSESDREGSQLVAIVNHTYARKLFGDQSPIGHWIGYKPAPDDHRFLIIGEVADARVDGLRFDPPPMVYFPINQNPAPVQRIEVRTNGNPELVISAIRSALHSIEPQLPITEIVTLNANFDDGLTREKLLARLSTVFGVLTLTLAALGFYGLLSFRMRSRTAEIGIRMAMGATRSHIQMLFLRYTGLILLAGIVPGIVLTEIMSRTAKKVLYGSGNTSMEAILFAIFALVIVGLLATLLPARRAASVDAMQVLRNE